MKETRGPFRHGSFHLPGLFYLGHFSLTFYARFSTFRREGVDKMPSVTFQIPSEARKVMSKYPKIKWDKVVADTLLNYARKLRLMDRIAGKGALSNQDVDELDKAIKSGLWKRYKNLSSD
jgi:hypothetical protein